MSMLDRKHREYKPPVQELCLDDGQFKVYYYTILGSLGQGQYDNNVNQLKAFRPHVQKGARCPGSICSIEDAYHLQKTTTK